MQSLRPLIDPIVYKTDIMGSWGIGETRIETDNIFYQEHVTNYVYEHSEKFRIKWIPISFEKSNIRLTTDTKEDFKLNQEIYNSINGIDSLGVNDLIKYIARNKVWVSRMSEQINKNKK